mmetsp:Transcript_99696/g.282145  ORF Transcript_99696/g.282145 Transcript_99696/m.282145 type:complete len:483 (+) Transcript_99696:482-1930(+)
MPLATRSTCSGWRAAPSTAAEACLQNASSDIRSLEAANSSKRASTVMPRFCTSALMAVEMRADFAAEIVLQAFLTLSTVPLHSLASVSHLICIFFSSRWASRMGPLRTFRIFSVSSLRHAFASPTHPVTSLNNCMTSCRAAAGVGNASSSEPAASTGAAASSSFRAQASMGSTFALATASTASASFFSLATMCAFLSSASLFTKAALARTVFLFMVSRLCEAEVTLGRSFNSSALASARGPGVLADSSLAFWLRNPLALLIALLASARALSMPTVKALKAVTSSRYFVPSFPFTVTKPTAPLETILHSIRVMPPSSALAPAIPVDSRTSPGSILEVVLLLAISNTSVTEICLTHVNLLLNMSLKFSSVMEPVFAESKCLKMAFRLSSGKFTSSRSIFSGSAASHATKASSEVPPICWKMVSSVMPSFPAACSLRASARTCALHATRKSMPSSSSSGAQTPVAFFTSSSKAAMTWSASYSTFF